MGGRVMLDRRANECTYDLGCTEMHESRGSDWLGLRHPLPEYPPACFTIKTWSFLFHLPVHYRQPSSSQLGSHLPVLDLILTTLRIISQSTLDLETETIECHLRNKRHSAGSTLGRIGSKPCALWIHLSLLYTPINLTFYHCLSQA